ncbi:MAG: 16S rRNA (adenine(1518)-N(6)/adenine(1519)-N(6))-dimethyltransferase RsmA [Bryobacteraceae bacterium]|nr:16S rRNA (adenine(1518)-N(6)/adenine(1519)-N(6))-dimethyltransferase RsmA [Bryobacteraceae bacterium]
MPRKFGQHFLRDAEVLARIAEACAKDGKVLEIGPGRGALTAHLLPQCERLVAVEIDHHLIAPLRIRFPALEVIEADVLTVNLQDFEATSVVGNLPYYITSPIIERVLEIEGLQSAVFLVQKEVAERIAAPHGKSDYGYLSAITQLVAHVELLFTVPPNAFAPPPKVDSAVIRLIPKPNRPSDFDAVKRFLGICFQHKRKTLRNNLRLLYPAIEDRPEAGLRAEQLPVQELLHLMAHLVTPGPSTRNPV